MGSETRGAEGRGMRFGRRDSEGRRTGNGWRGAEEMGVSKEGEPRVLRNLPRLLYQGYVFV